MLNELDELKRLTTLVEDALIEVFGHVPSVFVVGDIIDRLDMDRAQMEALDDSFTKFDIFYEIHELIRFVSPLTDKDDDNDGPPAIAAIKVLDAVGRGDEVNPAFRIV